MTRWTRILTVLRRDGVAALRDYVLAYMLFAPFMLALVLRFFIPVASDTSIRLVADNTLPAAAAERASAYAVVERVTDRPALERRVQAPDDALGLVAGPAGLALVAQGNEGESMIELGRLVAAAASAADGRLPAGPVAVTQSDLGETRSPVRIYGTASVLLIAALLGGMLAGLSVIEEKEGRMLTVLAVTPLSKPEYFVGKSVLAVGLPLLQAVVLVPFMGVTEVDVARLLVMMLATAGTALVVGFFLGAISPSQIAGIANLKFMFLVISASFLGAILVPAAWRWTLYWSPFYWSARGLIDVLEGTAAWPGVLGNALAVLALSAVMFVLLAPRIRRGLTPVGV